jgi:predicted nucleotidyltransferase
VPVCMTDYERITEQAVERFTAAFPSKLRCLLLLGSYVDGTANALSDIDLVVLFGGALAGTESAHARDIATSLAAESAIRLDILVTSEEDFPRLHSILRLAIKEGSTLLAGEEVRLGLEGPDLETFRREVCLSAYNLITRVLRGADDLQPPLDFPDAEAEFCGYTAGKIAAWQPEGVPNSKLWVALVTRIATARLAMEHSVMTCSKSESARQYVALIGDQWARLVEGMFTTASKAWGYQLPDDPADREWLRQQAAAILVFENHFIRRYDAWTSAQV